MKWIKIIGNVSDVTEVMEVGRGVMMRTSSYYNETVSEALQFIPDCKINEGGCSERPTIVSRSKGKGGVL